MGIKDNTVKIDAECNKIREILSDGKHRHHIDIEHELGIPHTTYYRRIQRIREEDAANAEGLAKINLEDRTQRIKDALDIVSTINEEIMMDKGQKGADRIAASAAYLSAEYWIWRAEQAGPHLPQIQAFINKKDLKNNAIQVSRPTEDSN